MWRASATCACRCSTMPVTEPPAFAGATAIVGIGELVTNDPGAGEALLGVVHDAAVVFDGGRIAWVGGSADCPAADEIADVAGAAVLPGFVDSHAHLVFAGDRAAEFAARMTGQPYSAGGIRETVRRTRAASDDHLRSNVRRLVGEFRDAGVTTFEIKSGYGLTVDDEARALRIAAGVHQRDDVPRRARRAVGVRGRPGRLRRTRHWPDARRVRPTALGGSTCSATREHSTQTRRERCWLPARSAGWRRGSTPTSCGTAPGFAWRWRSAPRRPITARTSMRRRRRPARER